MDYNTNVFTSGPLAAVYQAQDQSAKAGAADLQNLVKGMSLPKEQVEMQTYQHLLNDPNYVKANAQFQMAATQAKLGDEEKKVAVNGLDRLLIQLQSNPDPAAQQQLILQSFKEKGVDPTSPMGQAILADPFGKTKEARDKLVSTLGYTPSVAGQERIAELKGENALELAQARGDIQKSLIGQRAALGGGKGKPLSMSQYEADLRQRAGQGDAQAKQDLADLEESRLRRTTAGIEARTAPIMNLLQGRGAPAPQAKGGVIKLD